MGLSFHGCWIEDQSQFHISIVEIMAIRSALKKTIQYIHHSCVMISTANTTVVSYTKNQGRTHSPSLCIEIWEILHWCLEHHIILRIRHILEKFNFLADRLSILDKHLNTKCFLDQMVTNYIFQMLRFPNMDLFATRVNHKLPLYVTQVSDNNASTIDSLSMNLNNLHAYAFPPTGLIPSILTKIRQSLCRIVLIVFGLNVLGFQRCYSY